MTKADAIREYLTKHPKQSEKQGIAREMLRLNPQWGDPDNAKDLHRMRQAVGNVMGAHGEQRRQTTNPKIAKFFYHGFDKWAKENLHEDPEPWHEPFIIPFSIKRLPIIADLHSIHLDKNVMKSFLRSTKDKTAVLLNGDLQDSESIGRHLKRHNLVEYEKEIEVSHQIVKGLKQEFDHVYFKEGNHDAWLEKFLLTNAREIFRLRGLNLKELLRLGELGVHHIHNLKYIQYGDLDILHGHEFPMAFGMGVYPARGYIKRWQKFKKSTKVKILVSHCHRDDYEPLRSVNGDYSHGWVTPCMCRKGPSYNPYGGAVNGWTEAWIEDGVTQVKNIIV